MSDIGEQLAQLAVEACRYPPGHVKRQKALTQIVKLVQPKLWRNNHPRYADALQRTWMYFCQNICEGQTGRVYDPERSSIVTWLNAYLQRRLQDLDIEDFSNRTKYLNDRVGEDGYFAGPIVDRIPSPPDVPPILERVRAWVKEDANRDLSRTHLRDRPDINCQNLILSRLPPETGWRELAAEYGTSISTLSSFYQRQCLPRLRAFGESEGLL
ncbi:MAG: sigma-70 family RNA polymerase sigma factor [Cyanobacteria bacterium P01_F01_bin.33]